MSRHGYSGTNYDRYVERTDTSTLHKMKETFWTTKQAVIQKLGKKEDEHVVASDSQLDAKLEVFKAIQKSSMELLRAIEKYQDRLCALSMEENATGRFLKSNSGQDKTRAGKIMAAVGKSQSFAAQQRLALRVPLVRLYQEVETFRYRAISDTLMTINRMEGARTEYRGALLWMRDISENLDPDTYKQLEKFRKVQAQVKKTKAKFDKLKLDVMQKVDLLAASRCNMFSHVLANYQSSLLHFWEKTSRTMTAVAESFKGYQYYEFSIIKELQEPNKQLSDMASNGEPAERDLGHDFDPENPYKNLDPSNEDDQEFNNFVGDRLITLDEEPEEAEQVEENSSLQNLCIGDGESQEENILEDQSRLQQQQQQQESRIQPPADVTEPDFLDFGDDELANKELEKLQQDYDFTGKLPSIEKKMPIPKHVPKDLLSEDFSLQADDTEKDDMTILNDILNAPSTAGDDDFSAEWQAVFGHTPLAAGATLTHGEKDHTQNPAEFMPSSLLDMSQAAGDLNLNNKGVAPSPSLIGPGVPSQPQGAVGGAAPNTTHNKGQKPRPSKKSQKADMSAWFNLFADLDPLADPDAIGKKIDSLTDA